MSGRRTRRDRAATDDGDLGSVVVTSELLPDGSYGVGVSTGPDHAVVLDRATATLHAFAVLEAAELEVDDDRARAVVGDLAEHRPPS